jgi:DNA-binding CsgD family transcriptional regulator
MATESARMSLLDVLARLGRPAALVAKSGRVIFLNGEGEALLGGVVDKGHLRTWRRREQRDLDRVVGTAVEAGPAALTEPIALSTTDRDRTILAQAIPVSAALAGEPAALVLFSDPTGLGNTDPTAPLELLGLTRAEARIAARVGNGMSARQAADVLAITENTVRSTLKVIYGKLGIGKQSELARILARLDGFGTPTRRTSSLSGDLQQRLSN